MWNNANNLIASLDKEKLSNFEDEIKNCILSNHYPQYTELKPYADFIEAQLKKSLSEIKDAKQQKQLEFELTNHLLVKTILPLHLQQANNPVINRKITYLLGALFFDKNRLDRLRSAIEFTVGSNNLPAFKVLYTYLDIYKTRMWQREPSAKNVKEWIENIKKNSVDSQLEATKKQALEFVTQLNAINFQSAQQFFNQKGESENKSKDKPEIIAAIMPVLPPYLEAINKLWQGKEDLAKLLQPFGLSGSQLTQEGKDFFLCFLLDCDQRFSKANISAERITRCKEIIRYFQKNFNVLACDLENGNTALHLACAALNFPLMKILFELSVNTSIKNIHGQTPIDVAASLIEVHAEKRFRYFDKASYKEFLAADSMNNFSMALTSKLTRESFDALNSSESKSKEKAKEEKVDNVPPLVKVTVETVSSLLSTGAISADKFKPFNTQQCAELFTLLLTEKKYEEALKTITPVDLEKLFSQCDADVIEKMDKKNQPLMVLLDAKQFALGEKICASFNKQLPKLNKATQAFSMLKRDKLRSWISIAQAKTLELAKTDIKTDPAFIAFYKIVMGKSLDLPVARPTSHTKKLKPEKGNKQTTEDTSDKPSSSTSSAANTTQQFQNDSAISSKPDEPVKDKFVTTSNNESSQNEILVNQSPQAAAPVNIASTTNTNEKPQPSDVLPERPQPQKPSNESTKPNNQEQQSTQSLKQQNQSKKQNQTSVNSSNLLQLVSTKPQQQSSQQQPIDPVKKRNPAKQQTKPPVQKIESSANSSQNKQLLSTPKQQLSQQWQPIQQAKKQEQPTKPAQSKKQQQTKLEALAQTQPQQQSPAKQRGVTNPTNQEIKEPQGEAKNSVPVQQQSQRKGRNRHKEKNTPAKQTVITTAAQTVAATNSSLVLQQEQSTIAAKTSISQQVEKTQKIEKAPENNTLLLNQSTLVNTGNSATTTQSQNYPINSPPSSSGSVDSSSEVSTGSSDKPIVVNSAPQQTSAAASYNNVMRSLPPSNAVSSNPVGSGFPNDPAIIAARVSQQQAYPPVFMQPPPMRDSLPMHGPMPFPVRGVPHPVQQPVIVYDLNYSINALQSLLAAVEEFSKYAFDRDRMMFALNNLKTDIHSPEYVTYYALAEVCGQVIDDPSVYPDINRFLNTNYGRYFINLRDSLNQYANYETIKQPENNNQETDLDVLITGYYAQFKMMTRDLERWLKTTLAQMQSSLQSQSLRL